MNHMPAFRCRHRAALDDLHLLLVLLPDHIVLLITVAIVFEFIITHRIRLPSDAIVCGSWGDYAFLVSITAQQNP
jgi:hypothetical protein